MGTTIGIVLFVILIALIAMSRRGEKTTGIPPKTERRSAARPNGKFHAVSLLFADNACTAAKNTKGNRFLAASAPRIPLPECDAAECKCRYIHHADRRSGFERRGQYVASGLANAPAYTGRERRYRGDRRGSEPQNFFS